MGKKIVLVLFLWSVVAAAVAMTIDIQARVLPSVMVYNFVFLGVMGTHLSLRHDWRNV